MKFGVVIANYNGYPDLAECLESITAARPENAIVVVVDNGSSDDSAMRIASAFPHVTVMRNRANLGFGGANNQGAQRLLDSGADVVIMLNNDVTIAKDFFRNLESVFKDNHEIGAVAPKILNFYDRRRIESAGGIVSLIKGAPVPRGYGQYDSSAFDSMQITSSIAGPAIIITADSIRRIGLLNPVFFLGNEDTDYSLRAARSGIPIHYVPTVVVFHKGHKSGVDRLTGSQSLRLGSYFCTRNSLLLLSLHGTQIQKTMHAFFLATILLPWRLAQSLLSRQMVVRPIYWAILWKVNASRLPKDDTMVEVLLR